MNRFSQPISSAPLHRQYIEMGIDLVNESGISARAYQDVPKKSGQITNRRLELSLHDMQTIGLSLCIPCSGLRKVRV